MSGRPELWDFEDPVGSEERFMAAARRARGATRDILLTQVARARGLQHRFEEGDLLLAQLEAHASDPELIIWIALERGRMLRTRGDLAASVPFFDDAEAGAAAAGLEHLLLDAVHMQALVAPTAARRIALNIHGLDLAAASADPDVRAWAAVLLNNIGMVHAEEGDFGSALDAFEAALVAVEHTDDDDRIRVARWMTAWALRNLGRDQEALWIQRALKAELDVLGVVDPFVDDEIALLGG
jgi:tetratricopeptide (TPR) repeat protein